MIRFFFLLLFSFLLALPVSAQRRPQQLSPSVQAFAQQAQSLRNIEITLQRLSAQMDTIEQQHVSLAARVSKLERGDSVASKDDIAALKADLNAVRSQQDAMRGEIIEDLTTRIKKIAAQQQKVTEKPAQKSGYNHTVEAGQTISAIAEAYKVTPSSIIKANKITDPTKIRVGQKLFIPDP